MFTRDLLVAVTSITRRRQHRHRPRRPHRRVWTSRPRICHALYRAPVHPTRVSSLPYPTFIYPSTCLLRRCTPSLPPPTPRRTTRVSARFSLSPPASARSSRLRYLLHALSLFTPWIHGPTRTGSITMSAPFLGLRWKSSTYTSPRAFVVFPSVETVRDLRFIRSVLREHWGNH